MAWLPDGEKIRKFIRFDATHADRQTPHDGVCRAYALHRAAKMHSFFETRCRYIYLQHTHTHTFRPTGISNSDCSSGRIELSNVDTRRNLKFFNEYWVCLTRVESSRAHRHPDNLEVAGSGRQDGGHKGQLPPSPTPLAPPTSRRCTNRISLVTNNDRPCTL